MSKFSERLKELRTDKRLSQGRFAPMIGYGQQTISDWEKGIKEPTANAIIACAIFFDVTTDYLLGLERDDGSKIHINNSFNNIGAVGNVEIGNKNKD